MITIKYIWEIIYKNFLLILWFIIIILCTKSGCQAYLKERKFKNSRNKQNFTYDTLYHKTDTIYLKDTIISYKLKYQHLKTTIRDTVYINNKPLNIYIDSLVDNNLIIYTTDTVDGEILARNLAYKLKVPILIHDSMVVEKVPINSSNCKKWILFIGPEIGGNLNKFNTSAILGFSIDNKLISYRYGLLDKTHNIGLAIKLISKDRY